MSKMILSRTTPRLVIMTPTDAKFYATVSAWKSLDNCCCSRAGTPLQPAAASPAELGSGIRVVQSIPRALGAIPLTGQKASLAETRRQASGVSYSAT